MDGFENRDRNSFQTHEDPSGEDRSFENDQSHYRYKVNPVSQPYEDRYDDLKTSSFYNEGYKSRVRGSLKVIGSLAHCSPDKFHDYRRSGSLIFYLCFTFDKSAGSKEWQFR